MHQKQAPRIQRRFLSALEPNKSNVQNGMTTQTWRSGFICIFTTPPSVCTGLCALNSIPWDTLSEAHPISSNSEYLQHGNYKLAACTQSCMRASRQDCGARILVKGLANCKWVLQYSRLIPWSCSSISSAIEAMFTLCTLPQWRSFTEYLFLMILITASLSCFSTMLGLDPSR